MTKTIETQLADARRLLNAAITEYERGSKEYAANGLEAAAAKMIAVAKELRDGIKQEKEADEQLVYYDGVIVAVPVADNWEVRDTAILIRPQGHCVSITAPNGERWSV